MMNNEDKLKRIAVGVKVVAVEVSKALKRIEPAISILIDEHIRLRSRLEVLEAKIDYAYENISELEQWEPPESRPDPR